METEKTVRGAAASAFGDAGRTLKEQAMQKAQSAKDQVRELANAGRTEVAGHLGSVARALRGAGDQLGDESPPGSQYTRLAGDKLGEVAQYLRDRDAMDVAADVEDFARKNPAVFLGGCAIAGFLIGRFFKASTPEEPALELGDYDVSSYESPLAQSFEPAAGYGYDTRVRAMPRPPSFEPERRGVATPIDTPDPWKRGGNGGG